MVKVVLWGGLRDHAQGRSEFELEATTIHQVITRLGKDFPAMKPQLEENVSVAVDGQIFRDAWFVAIKPDAEVFILPKLSGG